MLVAYIAGPYRARGFWKHIPIIRTLIVIRNILRARKVALEYWKLGYAVICPHMNTALFDGHCPDNVWLDGDLELIKRSDVIVMVNGWRKSSGAIAEYNCALIWEKKVVDKGEL